MPRTSRVFISYSHDSSEHKQRVLALANRLRTEGVDAVIDQFVQDPDGGWQYWMEDQIKRADFILLVCTEQYSERVESPFQTDHGAGVFWEAMLVRSYLYESKGRDKRFIPTTFDADDEHCIPRILRSVTRYRLDNPLGYEALYRRLTNQPLLIVPDIGNIIVLPRIRSTTLPKEPTTLYEHEFSLAEPSRFVRLERLSHCNEGAVKSQQGSTSTFVRFDNYVAEDVVLYWISYEGLRVFYRLLEAGRSHLQQTYVTHPWVVTKKDVYAFGRCIAIFQPSSKPGIAVVDSKCLEVPETPGRK